MQSRATPHDGDEHAQGAAAAAEACAAERGVTEAHAAETRRERSRATERQPSGCNGSAWAVVRRQRLRHYGSMEAARLVKMQ